MTLLELHRFLVTDLNTIRPYVDNKFELQLVLGIPTTPVASDELVDCLVRECAAEVSESRGFYCLSGRQEIIDRRLKNYFYGFKREKLIKKFIPFLRHVPFVRGVALAGSQALGLPKSESDIDLLIIIEPKFLWLGRTLVTAYFQILGKRRHGHQIADRFCLNHYLAGVKKISELRNYYTACEYAKLRPLVYGSAVAEFQQKNLEWVGAFFPNFGISKPDSRGPLADAAAGRRDKNDPSASFWQKQLELALSGNFGQWLERKLKNWQLPKIRREEFILVLPDELSFHPQSKQRQLLNNFFHAAH